MINILILSVYKLLTAETRIGRDRLKNKQKKNMQMYLYKSVPSWSTVDLIVLPGFWGVTLRVRCLFPVHHHLVLCYVVVCIYDNRIMDTLRSRVSRTQACTPAVVSPPISVHNVLRCLQTVPVYVRK